MGQQLNRYYLRTTVITLLICIHLPSFSQKKKADWWKEPHRFVQFNLQVKDAPYINAEEIILYARDQMRAEGIMLNAGGIYAWYPTSVPYHQINPYMGNRDIFGEFAAAAKKHGLKILARVDFSKTTEKTFADHPEWFALKSDGTPNITGEPRFGDWDMLYWTCGNSPYRNEAVAMPVLKEIITRYDVDAFFFSFAKFYPSWSPYSKSKYRQLYGGELPEIRREANPEWETVCYYDTWKNWYKTIKDADPEVAVIGRLRMDQREKVSFMAEYATVNSTQPRNAYHEGWGHQDPRWKASIETNFARANLKNGERPLILVNTAPGLPWRHTSLPKPEFDFWMAQVVANGGNLLPSTTGFPAVMEDLRTLEYVGAFNRKIEKIQPYLKGNIKQAKVAVLNTRTNYKIAEKALNGFFEALTNHQIQFDVIAEFNLTDDGLKNYDLVILADQRKLDDNQLETIRNFIERGGKIISTFKTGMYDGKGNLRSTVFLGKERGLKAFHNIVRDQNASYLRLEKTNHPLFNDLGSTKIIPGGGDLVRFEGTSDPILTLVPPFAPKGWEGNPPERASFRKTSSAFSIVAINEKSIYFSNQIGKLTWEHRLPDHQQLIANAVLHLSPDASPFRTINYGGVMINIYRKDKGYLVFLTNNTGERPMKETTVLKNLAIEWNLSNKITKIHAILAGSNLDFIQKKGKVSFSLPELHSWEVIHVE